MPIDAALARLAARQHGVVRVDQLYAVGLSRSDVSYRVAVGRLHHVHRGVYAVGHHNLIDLGRFLAAVFAIGHGAALSGEAGTALHGFRKFRGGEIEVTVARDVRKRPGIRPHCVTELDRRDVTSRKGIPVTTPARTLLDISRTLPQREVRRAVNEALVQRKITVPLLYRQAAGPNGTALRALLADASPTRSELEDVALEFFKRHGFPPPETNVRVAGWEVDVLLPERLVIELDSAQFHDNALQRAQDARKQAALEAAGYNVERLRWSDVTRDEQATVRRICAPPTSLAA